MGFYWLLLCLCKLQISEKGKADCFMYILLYLVLTMVNVAIKLLEPSKALTVHDLEHVLLTSSDKESFALF